MSKTREQRIAEGWVERWGVYDWQDGKWEYANGGFYGPDNVYVHRRKLYDFRGALERAKYPHWAPDCRIAPRIIWTRKRPKPKPELKVGDEVMVRARVNQINSGIVGLKMGAVGGLTAHVWVPLEDIARAAKE